MMGTGLANGKSVQWESFLALILALAFIHGCGGVEVEFGPNERAMVNRMLKQVDEGIEKFDIRGKQAIDVFGQLPANLGKEGAKLIEFQLAEWGSAMFGKGVVAVDCTAEGVNQRCIKNLEMVKEALQRAVDKVNELEQEDIPTKEKKSKWATFLAALQFEPVLLDPHICFLDHESVKLQYTDAKASAVVLRSPSDGLLKVRGTGLSIPKPNVDGTRKPTFTVWVVPVDGSKETERKDISSCIRYTLDNTIQLDLNAVKALIGVGDSYIEIVTKSNPAKKVGIGGRNEIPFVYLDPPAPAIPPPARVVSLILGGRTEGDDEDPNRGFHVEAKAGDTVVARASDYCWGPTHKDADFPSVRFTNIDRDKQSGWWLFKEFSVPSTGQLWVKADRHHDCECYFTLTYTVQSFKWGDYDQKKKEFAVVEHQRFDRTYTSPKHHFRGDEDVGTRAWDFNWEGP